MNISQTIANRVRRLPKGKPFPGTLFSRLGSSSAVSHALARLVKAGGLERVYRGIYMRPQQFRFGKVVARPFDVINIVIKRTGETIQVHGAEAVRRLQLSTQVPMRPIFMTSGATRVIRVGNHETFFRHTSRRTLLLAGRPAGFAIMAMWYMGEREVSPGIIRKIRHKLGAEEFEAVMSVVDSMPSWMSKVVALHGPGTMRPSTALDMYRAGVLKVIGSYHGVNPRVFGSVARGTDTETSDLNLLLDDLCDLSFYEVELMQEELENLLGFRVDIQHDENLPDEIRDAVLAGALPV